MVTEPLPLRYHRGLYRGSDPGKGEPVEGIQTEPHHQLLHLVEAAQNAGYSEREIVQIVEDELEADAELDRAA
jgi:hypothetical protein